MSEMLRMEMMFVHCVELRIEAEGIVPGMVYYINM